MSVKLGYEMNFFLDDHQGPAVDSLSLIERIMGIIQVSDALLSESLGYDITFHSMLASMEHQGFSFQVDMEIDPPQQLILGDRMEKESLKDWFSRSHESLTRYVMNEESLEQLNQQLEDIQGVVCRENLLFRPVDAVQLEALHKKYRELWTNQEQRLKFSMKKVL